MDQEAVSVFPFRGFQRRKLVRGKEMDFARIAFSFPRKSPAPASTCTRPDEITVVPEERESSPRLPPPLPKTLNIPIELCIMPWHVYG